VYVPIKVLPVGYQQNDFMLFPSKESNPGMAVHHIAAVYSCHSLLTHARLIQLLAGVKMAQNGISNPELPIQLERITFKIKSHLFL